MWDNLDAITTPSLLIHAPPQISPHTLHYGTSNRCARLQISEVANAQVDFG